MRDLSFRCTNRLQVMYPFIQQIIKYIQTVLGSRVQKCDGIVVFLEEVPSIGESGMDAVRIVLQLEA